MAFHIMLSQTTWSEFFTNPPLNSEKRKSWKIKWLPQDENFLTSETANYFGKNDKTSKENFVPKTFQYCMKHYEKLATELCFLNPSKTIPHHKYCMNSKRFEIVGEIVAHSPNK